MLKHVVFFKFKQDVDPAAVESLEKSLAALPGVVPEIKQYEFGRDMVRSERSYDFCLVSAFDDLDAMKRYQIHPEHQKVIALVREICDSVLAVDFNC